MIHSQNPIKPDVPSVFMDILISTEELRAEFGDSVPKVAVYGGREASENVIKFLQLPASVRLFGKVEKLVGEKKVDESATKDRRKYRSKEEKGGKELSPEELRKVKEYERS